MDVCHCSRFRLKAESLRYYSPHACSPSHWWRQTYSKILTRSMRFLRNPPTGNHSRGQERGRYEGKARSRDVKRRIRSLSKANISSAGILWERRERGAKGSCSDMKHTMSAVTFTQTSLTWMQAYPSRTFVVAKNSNKRLEVGATLGETLNSYLCMHILHLNKMQICPILIPWTTVLGWCFKCLVDGSIPLQDFVILV